MSIKGTNDPWVVGEKVLADDINDTIKASQNFVESTLGETTTVPKALFLQDSDGKAYLTDSSVRAEVQSYLGIGLVAGVLNDLVPVQRSGLVEGFSGLEIGSDYYLAETGTSQSDISHTGTNVSYGDVGNVASNQRRRAWKFTLTKPTKLTDITVRLRTSGTPTGNFVARIYKGTPSTGTDGGGDYTGYEETLAAGSVTGTSADYSFFSGLGVILSAGTYYFHFDHDTMSSGNYFQMQYKNSVNSSTDYRYDSGFGTWNNPSGDISIAVDFVTETFVAGDITDYFFDNPKRVGIAVSATDLLLTEEQTVGNHYSRSSNTDYVAETDGFIETFLSSTQEADYEVLVSGTTRSGGKRNSVSLQDTSTCNPVKKGEIYHVRVNAYTNPTIRFVPLV
jgi:hypothetical protein